MAVPAYPADAEPKAPAPKHRRGATPRSRTSRPARSRAGAATSRPASSRCSTTGRRWQSRAHSARPAGPTLRMRAAHAPPSTSFERSCNGSAGTLRTTASGPGTPLASPGRSPFRQRLFNPLCHASSRRSKPSRSRAKSRLRSLRRPREPSRLRCHECRRGSKPSHPPARSRPSFLPPPRKAPGQPRRAVASSSSARSESPPRSGSARTSRSEPTGRAPQSAAPLRLLVQRRRAQLRRRSFLLRSRRPLLRSRSLPPTCPQRPPRPFA